MPRLTIITINRNNRTGLQKTISSVINQTFKDFEYIIIDGGSTDGSLEVVREFSNRITYWVSEPDGGIYDAMNKGIKSAKGEMVYFLNSGDYFFDEKTLHQLADELERKGNCDLYFGNILLVNHQGPVGFIKFENMDLFGLMHGMISHQTIIVKRSVFDMYGSFHVSYKISGDYDWLLNQFLRKSVSRAYVNVTMACYLVGGLSEVNHEVHSRERNLVRQKYFSATANLVCDVLYTSRLHRFLKRSWINWIIESLSSDKWKSLGLH